MKLLKNFLLVLEVLVIIVMGYFLLQKNSGNSILQAQIKQANHRADSLQGEMKKDSVLYQKAKIKLTAKYDSLQITTRSQMNDTVLKYKKEHQRIKHMSLSEGVQQLRKNLGEIHGLPSINIIDGDTNVCIAKIHVAIINNVYVSNDELRAKNKILTATNDTLKSMLQQGKNILSLRQAEIDACKQVVVQKDITIGAQDKSLKHEKKAKRQLVFKIGIPCFVAGGITTLILLR